MSIFTSIDQNKQTSKFPLKMLRRNMIEKETEYAVRDMNNKLPLSDRATTKETSVLSVLKVLCGSKSCLTFSILVVVRVI